MYLINLSEEMLDLFLIIMNLLNYFFILSSFKFSF